jgi:hypothetical protein
MLPIFRVPHKFGKQGIGFEVANPENFGHQHRAVVSFLEISSVLWNEGIFLEM